MNWSEENVARLHQMVNAGIRAADIAKVLGFTEKSVIHKMTRLGLRSKVQRQSTWTPEKDRRLREMVDAGLSNEEIARELGYSPSFIIDKKKSLGLRIKQVAKWTDESINRLREMVEAGIKVEEIARALGCSRNAVTHKMSRLGLKSKIRYVPTAPTSWTPEKEQRLREMVAAGASNAEIAQSLGFSVGSINEKKKRLGLRKKRTSYRLWTEETEARLRELVESGVSAAAIGEELGLAPSAVIHKMSRMGLRSKIRCVPKPSAGPCPTVWVTERVARLRELTEAGYSDSRIARELGVTRQAVLNKRRALGLKKPRVVFAIERAPRASKVFVPSVRIFDLEPEVVENPLPLIKLRSDQCRWPVANSGLDMLCCARHAQHGTPYCAIHHKRAYHSRFEQAA